MARYRVSFVHKRQHVPDFSARGGYRGGGAETEVADSPSRVTLSTGRRCWVYIWCKIPGPAIIYRLSRVVLKARFQDFARPDASFWLSREAFKQRMENLIVIASFETRSLEEGLVCKELGSVLKLARKLR